MANRDEHSLQDSRSDLESEENDAMEGINFMNE